MVIKSNFKRFAYLVKLYLHIPERPEEVCHCGNLMEGHNDQNHPGISVNCMCGYAIPTRCPVHPKQYTISKRAWDAQVARETLKRQQADV